MNKRYDQRGVSATKDEVHAAIKNADKGLYPQAFCKIFPDYLTGDENYCSIIHADGAGTKSVLAYLYWKETGDLSVWKGIAQDAIVMNTDDLICGHSRHRGARQANRQRTPDRRRRHEAGDRRVVRQRHGVLQHIRRQSGLPASIRNAINCATSKTKATAPSKIGRKPRD